MKYNSVKDVPVDSLDVIVKAKNVTSTFGERLYNLRKDEMRKARELIFDFIAHKEYQKIKAYSSIVLKEPNDYFRQYIAEKNENTVYVYVILSDCYMGRSGYMFLKEFALFNRGYTIKVDLTRNRIVDFWSNQRAV